MGNEFTAKCLTTNWYRGHEGLSWGNDEDLYINQIKKNLLQ